MKPVERLHQILYDEYGVGPVKAPPVAVTWAVTQLKGEIGASAAKRALSDHNRLRDRHGAIPVVMRLSSLNQSEGYDMNKEALAKELVVLAKSLMGGDRVATSESWNEISNIMAKNGYVTKDKILGGESGVTYHTTIKTPSGGIVYKAMVLTDGAGNVEGVEFGLNYRYMSRALKKVLSVGAGTNEIEVKLNANNRNLGRVVASHTADVTIWLRSFLEEVHSFVREVHEFVRERSHSNRRKIIKDAERYFDWIDSRLLSKVMAQYGVE
jgi:hypothetical protein